MKFKVGDKVQVVGKASWGCPHIGKIGVVHSIRPHTFFLYRVRLNSEDRDYKGRELEKVE